MMIVSSYGKEHIEVFLNGEELSGNSQNSVNSEKLKITEA